jgi:signal transduction histidine kinase
MIQPVLQELENSLVLSPRSIATLDGLFDDSSIRNRFPHVDVWLPDGTVVYSLSKEIIGSRFPVPPGVSEAAAGEVAAQYTDPTASEHAGRGFGAAYLEIYSPIFRSTDKTVVAVAEIHADVEHVRNHFEMLRVQTWLIVAGMASAVILGLMAIVARGNRLIQHQRQLLGQRAQEAEQSRDEINDLRRKERDAAVRVAELNESFVRGLGAELHDGPAQLVSYAMMHLGTARTVKGPVARERAYEAVSNALNEALIEIRSIASSVLLPDIDKLEFAELVGRAIRNHEARTATHVVYRPARDRRVSLPAPIKVLVYRFLQEGLTNAYRHAGGNGQRVEWGCQRGTLTVSVIDGGPLNADATSYLPGGGGMGIEGLKQRVESFGGSLSFSSHPDGTRLDLMVEVDSLNDATV